MLHVWATCNMAQSLCTWAFESHYVIWLYVFHKILLLNNTSILFNNTTGRFFIPPVVSSNNIVVFDGNCKRKT